MHQKIENIFSENNFIIYSETKLIIKNKKQVVEFFLADISNVRILKRRNIYPNIITFYLILIITSTRILTAKSNDIIFFIIDISIIFVLLIFTFFLKNYNHKLLINKGKHGFSEIILQKKNIKNANKFLNDFNSNKILKFYPENFENSKFKECI